MLVHLKIKIKTLAAEAVIIRHEERPRRPYTERMKRALARSNEAVSERRIAGDRETWFGLKQHRRFDVREEARSALLAYGFLRGRAYRRIEAKCWLKPNWGRVLVIAKRFGDRPDLKADDLKIWAEAELVHS